MKFGFVKCGVSTPEIKVADTIFNANSIKREIEKAVKRNVEILVLPELCITGYTVGDLIFSNVLLDGALRALKNIADFTLDKKITVFVGLPIRKDGLLYNVSACINNGKILGVIPKTYIPNYNEFYEKRYFACAFDDLREIEIGGEVIPFGKNILFCDSKNDNVKIAVEICEDMWAINPPSISHAINGATIICNLSASDEIVGRAERRQMMVDSLSSKLCSAYLYADAGEGESTTDCVYAGHNIISECGHTLIQSKLFNNEMIVSDIDTEYIAFERSKHFNYSDNRKKYLEIKIDILGDKDDLDKVIDKTPFVPKTNNGLDDRAEEILNIQSEGLKKRIKHTGAKSLVVGLSGGLDSTLAILVAVRAIKKLGRDVKDIIAVTMPCFGTTSRTFDNTIKLAKALNVTLKKVDITKSVLRHLKDIKHQDGVLDATYENAQARERTQVLMDLSNQNGGLVIGTGDLSELALGWATYNGDHMSMYGVNCSIPKTLVRHVVEYSAKISKGKLKAVLLDILDTPVSPELLPPEKGDISQKTEDIVGPYLLHDFFLFNMIRKGYSPLKIYYVARRAFSGEFSDEIIGKWLKIFIRRFFNQQFKRSCVPDGVKIGSVALSPRGDWRMPSDAMSTIWLKELENI